MTIDVPVATLPPSNASIEVCAAPDVGAFPTGISQVSWTGNVPVQTLNATLNGSDFSSADPFTVGRGAALAFAGTAIAVSGIDQASAAAALADGDYIEYTFRTAPDMPAGRTLNNISRQSFAGERHNFDMAILVSDDPTFASAHIVVEDASVTAASRTFHPFSDALVLQPDTDYYVRVLTYNNTTTSGDVGYDDMVFSTVLCADYSDTPTGFVGATHAQQIEVQTHFLGDVISNDIGTLASTDASGDGATDDGITLPALTQGQTATITADVTGAGGFLQGWIDFDGNGAFENSEQVAADLQDDGTGDDATADDGTITFDVDVPFTATTDQTFARFRWSTTAGLDTTTAALDGEVEDYALTIEEQTFVVPAPSSTIETCAAPIVGAFQALNKLIGGRTVLSRRASRAAMYPLVLVLMTLRGLSTLSALA